MDIQQINATAWNKETARRNAWTIPVTPQEVQQARDGELELRITTFKNVPPSWLQGIKGKKVLCLASGGGQQGPLLAAAGASVVVLDASDRQLEQDQMVAKREHLAIETVQGDMRDLSCFADASFDMIVNPISNCFIDTLQPMWDSCWRVLRPQGTLLCGLTNPVLYIFDDRAEAHGKLKVKYTLPFADPISLSKKELAKRIAKGDTIEFSHTLETQLGGICNAGFSICGLFTDSSGLEILDSFVGDCFIAVRAQKELSHDA